MVDRPQNIPVAPTPCSVTTGLLSAVQHTLEQAFTCSGIGLHTGLQTQVQVTPAPINSGRIFVRSDLPNQPEIPAQISTVSQALLSTELAVGSASIRTVEHLLAALVGMGVDNVRIEVNGPEIPLLDGSALPWTRAIAEAGITAQATPRQHYGLTEPILIQQAEAFVAALPAPSYRFTYGIDFELAAIGNQWQSWAPAGVGNDFATAIAPARTFGLAHQVEQLRAQGLIRGGSLDNALVCGEQGWLNPPLRFANEPVRHKLLDLVGDLSLLGVIPQAHFIAYKASHQLHLQLAHALSKTQLWPIASP